MKTSLFARTALGASLLLASPYSLGQQRTEPIVVTATRSAVNPFDVAASIDVVDGETLRSGQLQVNLSETLARIPGINVQNRSNSTGLIFACVAHGPLPTAHSNSQRVCRVTRKTKAAKAFRTSPAPVPRKCSA